MKRKIFAGVLVSALAVLSMAGCGQQTTDSASSQVSSESENVAIEEYLCKIVSVGDATSEACAAVSEAASQITLEKFNTRLDIQRLSYGTFFEEVNLMLSSGEKLDLFPNFAMSVITAANTGQVLALDDLLEGYGQDILAAVPDYELSCNTINGSIYGIPNDKDKAEGFGVMVRTDMLEATDYDISQIKTEADLEGLYAAVKELYPNTYPLVSDNGNMGYFMIYKDDLGGDYGTLMNCLEEGPMTVENLYASEEYREMVQLRYDWAQKGFIMPDAATNTQNAYDLIATGKGFSYYCNTKPGIEAEWERKVGQDMTVIELIEPYRTSTTGMNSWMIAHNSEKPERAMEVLNEMRSNPDLSNTLINGIEGEHYLVDEADGVLTYPDGVDASNTTYSSVAWIWPNELISIPWEADGAEIWEQTDAYNKAASLSSAFGFVWDNANVINEITACNNVLAKYGNALNCGSLNPAEALDKLNQELKDAGIDRIIEEKQAQLDAWAASQE